MEKFKKILPQLIILLGAVIVSIPLLFKNLNIYQDDGVQHICRLIGTWQTLQEGQFLPMIMSKYLNGFGYSWNIFYSPLTAYAPLLFKIFNISFVNSFKLFLFVVTYLSGLAMYKCTLSFINKDDEKSKIIASFSAILYMFAPYRLTDMYIRMAVSELTSFIFIPIIFEGLNNILSKNKKSYKLAWGTIGLILTHTVVTMYMAIICFIYVAIVIIFKIKNKESVKKQIIEIIKNLAFALVVTSFYLVPLVEHYFATSYEVFVPGRMQRIDVLKALKVKFHELFLTTSNQTMIYEIGLAQVVGLIITPFIYKKLDKKLKVTYTTFLVLGVMLSIMTLTIFPFEKLPSFLTMIQFTFRLLEFTAFFFSFIVAINYGTILKGFNIKDLIVLNLIVVLLTTVYTSKLKWGLPYDEQTLTQNPKTLTSQTGRVHAGMASMEYMPSKMFNNKNYVVNRKDEPVIVNSNKTTIKSYEKNDSKLKIKLENAEAGTVIELPYTYYLGYRIYENGKEIKYTESDYGFVQITLSKDGDVTIESKYLGTNAMLISFAVSVIRNNFINNIRY